MKGPHSSPASAPDGTQTSALPRPRHAGALQPPRLDTGTRDASAGEMSELELSTTFQESFHNHNTIRREIANIYYIANLLRHYVKQADKRLACLA